MHYLSSLILILTYYLFQRLNWVIHFTQPNLDYRDFAPHIDKIGTQKGVGLYYNFLNILHEHF